METEVRTLANNIEVGESDMVVEGYALRFNQWSEILGNFREVILPEALNGTVFDDVRLLFNHDWSNVLGRQTAKTLEIIVDDIGLRFKAKLPNTNLARDVYESIKAGNINQCSFEFFASDEGKQIEYDPDEKIYKHTITKIDNIREISIVSLPAYKTSDVKIAQRSIEKYEIERRRKLSLLKLEHEYLNL
ncbi:HK97 family phage prohead protease [Macrococcus capreoli]|uniref:HK97 family phage prohead protease n=1 Tax=Macrococcus capreoli TaxID=2982690 RepID=UPI0021D57875|nr:HK97 family phage prohead protease [Macrococcus sp. TMW 2.2395]MCU7557262.1 HK97 family phage prohead protease [Macrococcus sp. TMW 2.2395]